MWTGPPNGPYMQNIAVVVFFVLSGCLITHSTRLKLADKARTYRATDYFIDRFSRIYTAFVPALFLILLLDLVINRIDPNGFSLYRAAADVPTFFGNLFMLQDFPAQGRLTSTLGVDPITSFGSARPLWTVAIEWWIYLAVGWALLVRLRAARSSHPVLVLYLLPLIPLAIVPLRNSVDVPFGSPGRGGGLFLMWLMGASVSFIWPRMARSSVPRPVWLGTSVLIAGAAVTVLYALDLDAYRLEFAAALALALACGIAGLEKGAASRAALSETMALAHRNPSSPRRFVKWVADYSFSLYLLHYTIFALLLHWARPTGAWFIIFVIVANVVSIVFARVFERRYPDVRRWLQNRFNPGEPTLTQISRTEESPAIR